MSELFLGKYRAAVSWINGCIVTIPPFWICVGTTSKGIRLGSKSTRTETDKEIKTGKEFGPPDLATTKNLCSCEVFQVLVIGDHIDRSCGAFKIVSPDTEGFKNGKEFFVVGVVVQFGRGEGTGVESDRMYFIGVVGDGENGTESIVGGVSLNNDRTIRDPMS
jgi:hypothetical protein